MVRPRRMRGNLVKGNVARMGTIDPAIYPLAAAGIGVTPRS
jgi:hypothetical protein